MNTLKSIYNAAKTAATNFYNNHSKGVVAVVCFVAGLVVGHIL